MRLQTAQLNCRSFGTTYWDGSYVSANNSLSFHLSWEKSSELAPSLEFVATSKKYFAESPEHLILQAILFKYGLTPASRSFIFLFSPSGIKLGSYGPKPAALSTRPPPQPQMILKTPRD